MTWNFINNTYSLISDNLILRNSLFKKNNNNNLTFQKSKTKQNKTFCLCDIFHWSKRNKLIVFDAVLTYNFSKWNKWLLSEHFMQQHNYILQSCDQYPVPSLFNAAGPGFRQSWLWNNSLFALAILVGLLQFHCVATVLS